MSCSKLAFHSPEQAQRTAEIIVRQGLRPPGTAPRRLYLCPDCEKWHWTSQAASYDGTPSIVLEPPKVEPPPKPPPSMPEPAGPSVPVDRNGIRLLPPGPTRQAIHFRKLETQATKRCADYRASIAWIKNALRLAASRVLSEGTDEAIVELIVTADMVVGMPSRGRFDDPDVQALLARRADDKRQWVATRVESWPARRSPGKDGSEP